MVYHNALSGSELHDPLGSSVVGALTLTDNESQAYEIQDGSSNALFTIDTTTSDRKILIGDNYNDPLVGFRSNTIMLDQAQASPSRDSGLLFYRGGGANDTPVFLWDEGELGFVAGYVSGATETLQNATYADDRNVRMKNCIVGEGIEFRAEISDPTPGTNEGHIYIKDDGSSRSVPFFIGDGGTAVQMCAYQQQSDIGALILTTHSGTPNTTLVDVSGSGDDGTINDNFHELGLQINNIRTYLRTTGGMA